MLKIIRASIRDADKLARLSKLAFDDDVHYGAPGPGGPPGYDDPAWQRRMMKLGEYYKIKASSVEYKDNELSFKVYVEGESVKVKTTLQKDTHEGTASYSEGTIKVSGKKKA